VQLDTAQIQKNQQDTEPEAGEQTLAGWWLRSQASWHQGAGYRYAETRGEVKESNFFLDSLNVDVWTQGQVSLLRKAVEVSSSSNRSVAMVPANTLNQTIVGQAGSVKMYEQFGGGLVTNLYSPGGISFDCVVATEACGSRPATTARCTPDWTAGLTTDPESVVAHRRRPDQADSDRLGEAPPLGDQRQQDLLDRLRHPRHGRGSGRDGALYTHPSSSWVYTDIADVPGGVLFSGYGDGASHLQRVSLDTDGAAPTMAAATTTAILPSDERALRINSLTGAWSASSRRGACG
jgi:hypothetical protein